MAFACLIIGWALIGLGVLGCFINKIPGPLMSFIGLLIFVFGTGIDCPWWVIALVALMVVASMVLSKKFLPKVGKLVAEYGKAGSWGTMFGSLFGLAITLAITANEASTAVVVIMLIVSFLLLPYVLAFLLELIVRKSAPAALNAAGGALVAFLVGTMLKLAVCATAIYSVTNNVGA